MHGLTRFGINSEWLVVEALSKLETPDRLCTVGSFVNVNRHRVHNLPLNVDIDRLSLMDEDVSQLSLNESCNCTDRPVPGVTFDEKEALLATVRFRRREFRLTPATQTPLSR